MPTSMATMCLWPLVSLPCVLCLVSLVAVCISFLFLKMFIYFEREGGREEGRGRERERKRIPSRLCADSPGVGLELINREIMT